MAVGFFKMRRQENGGRVTAKNRGEPDDVGNGEGRARVNSMLNGIWGNVGVHSR